MRQLHVELTDNATNKSQILMCGVDSAVCTLSRFNTRKVRSDEDIQRLAERMATNGYELTRALWVYENEDNMYEVFAGGTRLQAAIKSSIAVDIIVHEGYSWDEISRLSDQDNENDEYHTPVRPADVWAEYARLRDVEGWAQKQIAQAKGVPESRISERLNYHALPDNIKDNVGNSTDTLTEKHLAAVFDKIPPVEFLQSWTDLPTWRIDVLHEAIEKPISSSRLKKRWGVVKSAVNRANEIVEKLPDGVSDEYLYTDDDGIERVDVEWREVFCDLLIERDARSTANVNAAFGDLTQHMEASRKRKKNYDANLEKHEQAIREEALKIETFREQCVILIGDVTEQLRTLADESIDVIITSPPYNLGSETWPMGSQQHAIRQPRSNGIGYDDTLPEDVYQEWQVDVLIELYRVAKQGASFFYNHKVRQREGAIIHPMDWLRCERNPWIVRQEIIWDRKSTHNHVNTLFWPQDERIYWMTKGKPELPESGIKMPSVWAFHGPVVNTWHPAPFSEELPMRILEAIERPTITVLDPFAGSFTTIKIALERGHKAIGIEHSQEYVKQAIEENQWPIAI